MDDYKLYLYNHGMAPNTIKAYITAAKKLEEWFSLVRNKTKNATLKDLYNFRDSLITGGLSTGHSANYARSTKHYFSFLGVKNNPALLLVFQQGQRGLPQNRMDEWTLREFYRSIYSATLVQKRDKAMMGLIIFQAIKREELALLELEDINFEKKTVRIPGTRVTNGRTLEMEPEQYNDLLHYIMDIRSELLKESDKQKSPFLFFSQGASENPTNAFQRATSALKTLHPSFLTMKQMRSSRITIWIEKEGLAVAQYKSGMRYLSSLVRYQRTDVEQLKQKLKVFHPMEKF